MRIGYMIVWDAGSAATMEYSEARAAQVPMGEIFPSIVNTRMVLCAEKLKNPGLRYEIVEVHTLDLTAAVLSLGQQEDGA